MDPSKTYTHAIDIGAIEGSSSLESLRSSIEGNIEAHCSSVCIYKVPEEISIDDSSVFVPVKVSIGPFHYCSPHLASMEDHKWRYLSSLLKRESSVQNPLADIVKVIAESESRVRKCYAVEFDLSSEEFNQMMLLDCCFILELLLRFSIKSPRRRTDPIFTTPGLLFELRCDMILLENQVPFFLLRDIFGRVRFSQLETDYLYEIAFRFFRTIIVGERQFLCDKFRHEADHFLDVVHYCFLSTYPRVETRGSGKPKTLPSASTVQKKGIKFKVARNAKSLLDIKFQDGILEIPTLKVYNRSETILRNLIAYEHCQLGSAQQVKSYVYLMGHLLDSDGDVKLFCRRKILTDNDNDETQVIQNLKWMKQQRSSRSGAYFAGLIQQVNEGSCRYVMQLRRLKRNPVVIGIGALLVVAVIFAAAFFSALSFLRHRYE